MWPHFVKNSLAGTVELNFQKTSLVQVMALNWGTKLWFAFSVSLKSEDPEVTMLHFVELRKLKAEIACQFVQGREVFIYTLKSLRPTLYTKKCVDWLFVGNTVWYSLDSEKPWIPL